MAKKKTKRSPFDKYDYYTRAVQSAGNDVRFFRKAFRELKNKEPHVLREDFCAAFAVCREWIKLDPKNKAIGIDLDLEPINYGIEQMKKEFKVDQLKRLELLNKNVMASGLPKADIVATLNFSHFIFQDRATMKKYFQSVKKSLKPGGLFIQDVFGGSATQTVNTEETSFRGFKYIWDQVSFDPITNRAKFYIHFKIKGQKENSRVFSYDWRLWSLPELRELLHEVGFKKTYIYWEGTGKDGEGNGVFRRREKGEDCEGWIAYIIAE